MEPLITKTKGELPRLVDAATLTADDKLALHAPPRAVIAWDAFQFVAHHIQLCPTEINGRGSVRIHNGDVMLSDPFLLDQIVSGAEADDSDAFLAYMSSEQVQGRSIADVRWQWHSHVDFAAFFSGTDAHTIASNEGTFRWVVSLVMNKRLEYACQLDMFDPVRLAVELPLFVELPEPSTELDVRCKESIACHVREIGVLGGLHACAVATPSVRTVPVVIPVGCFVKKGDIP